MQFDAIPIWKEAPFLRLLIPFAAGILSQWNFKLDYEVGFLGTAGSLILLLLFSLKTFPSRFKMYWLSGVFLNCLFFFAGSMLTFSKDGAGHQTLLAKKYAAGPIIIARLDEPLSEKAKSFKAQASIHVLEPRDSVFTSNGDIIIYLQKDSTTPGQSPRFASVGYGSTIVFNKKLQPIQSSGNPGGFNYKRYCAFQGIYYQVYLKTTEYRIIPRGKVNPFREFVFRTRTKIITILQQYIPGDKESGLAEALLIGYKEDLDKNLVQSYSNTGVVHIIAVSGLHVGIIYWLINSILHFLNNIRKLRFLKPVSIIAALWIFCFLAGGSPSVLRSGVMFTFIVLGQNISRKISIYNSLAGSAFFLLCYNPFWLWDTGFQLSYAAVLSIIVFMKPIYNSLFVENKMLDALWKLNSVTLSAQVLTVPLCLYYFHLFPIFFLITNLIAIPLSSIILIGELLVCAVSGLPVIATKVGWLLKWLIWLMNSFIELFDRLRFSVLQNIQISTLQVISLYLIITGLAIWIMNKKAIAFAVALVAVLIFGVIRSHSLWIVKNQRKLIVYNIPFNQSIDFIEGNKYFFKGDSALNVEGFAQNFHLKPARTAYHLAYNDLLPGLIYNQDCYMFNSRRVIIVERPLPENNTKEKIDIDVIVISKSPKLSIVDLNNRVNCKQIVVDASNPSWKSSKWKVECDALGIPCHVVSEKGAFVMSMN